MCERFCAFLDDVARPAEALFILGDWFDYWVGDDAPSGCFDDRMRSALERVRQGGTRLYLMHGNRDFLLGRAFAEACGATLLPDPYYVVLYGTATVLMHGDLLCSDDVRYQAFRAEVRKPEWQADFLARPLPERQALVQSISRENELEKNRKTESIMDVTQSSVIEILRSYGYPRLIHGHTHRPAHHLHEVDGRICERWVLPDWYETGGYLRCDSDGCKAFPAVG
jgi:UDP-2,3-diacylglucosamine hydrolase